MTTEVARPTAPAPEGLRELAVQRLRKKRDLQAHVLAYVMVNLLLNRHLVDHHAGRVLLASVSDAGLGHRLGVQRLGRLRARADGAPDRARDEPPERPVRPGRPGPWVLRGGPTALHSTGLYSVAPATN